MKVLLINKACIRSDLVRFKNILCFSKIEGTIMPKAITSLRRISSVAYEKLCSLKKTQAGLTQT